MQSKRTTVYRHADLTRLLHPASVAVIGASTRAGSFGERVLVNLQHYGGRMYPVNARYERIGDQRCYPDVATLPEVPDCAVVTAPREAVEEIVLACAAAGVGGVIVFASGYAETGKDDRIAQQQRLAAIARETDMRIVGPNCIGVVNAPLDMRVTFMDITPIPPPRKHSIGMVSQSGALGMALAQAVVRGVSFSHVLTSGNSCDVDMADYISLSRGRSVLRRDCLRIRRHGRARAHADRCRECLAARQAADRVQDGDRRAGCRGGDVAYRLAGRIAGGVSRGVPSRRCDPGG